MAEVHASDVERVALSELTQHPANPRMGDVGAIAESIEANGFYGVVVAQRSTGRILAGNHRVRAAEVLGLTELPVIYLDVDDDRALRILLADNRTNDLASYDDAGLVDLLADLAQTQDGLTGTGYDGDVLDELLADLDTSGFTPGGENPALDQLDPKWATCPECGHKWDQRVSS